MSRPHIFRDYARDYIAAGISVFPLQRRGKFPAIPNAHPRDDDPLRGVCKGTCGRHGHGLHDATTDPDVIDEWRNRYPNSNIGGRTGLVFDVLDVDDHHGGFDTLARLVDDHGPLEPGAVSLTGRGGAHYFFAPTGQPNRAGIVRRDSGLDWRGDGGYVVLPPSIHENSNAYEWVFIDDELPDVPAWLATLIEPPRPAPLSTIPKRAAAVIAPGLLADRARLVRDAGIGTRNDTLYRQAFFLACLTGDGVLAEGEVCAELEHAAAAAGLGEREITTTIKSAFDDAREARR